MIPAIGQPEEIRRVAPLGVRFWDPLSRQPVSNGLSVTAYPLRKPMRRATAFANHFGIYVFQDLPGIRESEFGAGDEAYWSNVRRARFEVEVIDLLGRFQAFTFQVDLPFRGLFTDPCLLSSPLLDPTSSPGVPLCSAMTRGILSGISVVYATLWDAVQNRPASWAAMEASLDGEVLARGFADRDGRVALFFPHPQLPLSVLSPPGSPFHGNRPALADQSWSIQLQAFYTPREPIPEIPDICQVFRQSPVRMMDTLVPQSPLTDISLLYGEKLVLRSASRSFVWVMP